MIELFAGVVEGIGDKDGKRVCRCKCGPHPLILLLPSTTLRLTGEGRSIVLNFSH